MNKTSTGLVNYITKQLGNPYWWGTFGQYSSETLLNELSKDYPSQYGSNIYPPYLTQLGKKVHDCSGLIKGYLMCDTPTSSPKYKKEYDVNAAGLYANCSSVGNIGSIPEITGVLVFQTNLKHVGVYIGNGEVIEARGHSYGVVKTKLKNRTNFTIWGKLKWIEYPDNKYIDVYNILDNDRKNLVDFLPMLKQGITNTYVKLLQILLQYHKYNIEADGIFGPETKKAVIDWQTFFNIEVDGVVGPQTWSSLIYL